MKPVLKKTAFLAMLFMTLVFLQSNAQNTNAINCLKFSSVTEYENAISNYSVSGFSSINGYNSYQSMKSTFQAEQPPAGFDEEQPDDDYDVSNDQIADDSKDYNAYAVLSELLNTDKVMVIGNWIIKIDLENQRGLLLNTQFAGQYNDVLNNNLSNTNIQVLGMDADGVEVLQALDKGESIEGLKIGCSAPGEKDQRTFYNGNRRRLDAKVVYQRGIFLFSLEGKGKTQKRFLGLWWDDGKGHASMKNINLSFRQCKGKRNGFDYHGDPCQTECLPGYKPGAVCTYRPYLGTIGLNPFSYAIDFVSTHGSGHVEIKSR
jgi:hypothetical protein